MPKIIYRAAAPLRLGLAGGGTDVSPYSDIYGGAVVNATINMFATASIIPRHDHLLVFKAINQNHYETYALNEGHIPIDGPLELIKATYVNLKKRFGFKCRPIEITIHSDAPIGSGLGSSSTCTVALVSVLTEFFKLPLSTLEIARAAYEIERNDLAITGGKQDQYAATYGGINLMEFYEGNKVVVSPIQVKKRVLHELQHNLVLYFTNSSRMSSHIIQEQIDNVNKKKDSSIDAMHSLKAQALDMKDALVQGEIKKIGDIVKRGWEAKKSMAHGISTPSIQLTMEKAIEAGASGGKISGAGGGGFMFLFCPENTRYPVIETLESIGGYVKPFTFVKAGVRSWKQKY
jgi:D-glycero-alpha-D-manno-heptose-7-phosphate kinase